MKSEFFICINCGKTFECPKICHDKVPYGDTYVDGSAYEECPFCGGDFENAYECEECGELFLKEDLIGGICSECFEELAEKYEYEPEKCKGLSATKREVSLNEFFTSIYSDEEIEQALIEDMKRHKVSCRKFIEYDPEWFVEVTKENEND